MKLFAIYIGGALRSGQLETQAVAVAEAGPADPRRQALELDLAGRSRESVHSSRAM
jgi:hypothetical protein